MDKIIIKGKANLFGSINVSGSKNAALPILVSSLLNDEVLVIKNLPKLNDIKAMISLLENYGVNVLSNNSVLHLNSNYIENNVADYDLVRKMRASILILGPLLTRFNEVKISLPGGCAIGTRPIDIHLFGLNKLGVNFDIKNGFIIGKVNNKLIGSSINLPFPSVGATENIMMAATRAEGVTTISNAAKEPEISDLANCLNKMGAKISGEGTNQIKIIGVNKLYKAEHSVISDRIVAGTYIIAAVMLNKEFTINNFDPEYLSYPLEVLKKMGANFQINNKSINVLPSEALVGINIETAPYPGFPTDLQAQMMTLMTLANGFSQIKENIFENRFMHVSELNRLGANIRVKNEIALIEGGKEFKGAPVMASDLRASVSLVLAGLCAEGVTTVNRVYHLDRGYEKIEETLGKCGPKIVREK